MLAMSLLLLDFAAIPVLTRMKRSPKLKPTKWDALVVLAVLLVLYYRRWSAWRASQRGAQGAGSSAKGA